MDPLTAAGTFATLVGLLGNFKAERGGQELSEFMAWLREHHQDQIVARIEADHRLTSELKVLLARSQSDLTLKLQALDEQLPRIAQHIEGLEPLARHLAPASPLSTQAVNVLQQIVSSGADFAVVVEIDGGALLVLAGVKVPGVNYPELSASTILSGAAGR